jgi:uncharacterized protein YjbI with pentapeptide repeats
MQEGRDFIFAELFGVDLTGADFYLELFHSANNADLTGADLRNANIDGANITGRAAPMRGCVAYNSPVPSMTTARSFRAASSRNTRDGRGPSAKRGAAR